LQCGAVRCSALQCVAVRCSALQCGAVRCSSERSWPCVRVCVLQCVAVRHRVRELSAPLGTLIIYVLQCVAMFCHVLQCVAVGLSLRGVSEQLGTLSSWGVGATGHSQVEQVLRGWLGPRVCGKSVQVVCVLQCGAVWCSVLQCGAVWCSVLHCGAVWCSVMQGDIVYVGAPCNSSVKVQCVAVCCDASGWSVKVVCSGQFALKFTHIPPHILRYPPPHNLMPPRTCTRVAVCVATKMQHTLQHTLQHTVTLQHTQQHTVTLQRTLQHTVTVTKHGQAQVLLACGCPQIGPHHILVLNARDLETRDLLQC